MRRSKFRLIADFLARNQNYLPYILLIVFIGAPLTVLFHHDFWDGSRVGYAQDSNDFTGVHFWLSSASMEGQYFQEYLVNQIADSLKISSQLFGHIIVVVSLVILVREVTIIAKDYLLVRQELIFIPGLIVAIFPSLSLTVSSILVYYISSLSIGWYCARKFVESKSLLKAIAFLGMIYSFEYAVMLLVCPVLVFFFLSNEENKLKSQQFRGLKSFVLIAASAMVFKTLLFLFNQPEGPMLGYNQIRLPMNLTDLGVLIYGVKSYSSFLLYPILVITPAWLWAFTQNQKPRTNELANSQSRTRRMVLIVLLVASVAPYLAVGKSTSLFWLDFWSGRHSFALIPALALFSVSILDWFIDQVSPISRRELNVISSVAAILIISLSSLLLLRVLGVKYLEQQNRLGIIQSLSSVQNEIPPGTATLYVNNSEFLELNPDESNYLMYKVKKNLDTFTLLATATTEPNFPSEIYSPPNRNQSWTLYNFPEKVCHSKINILRISPKSNFPKLVISPKYKVEKVESACP